MNTIELPSLGKIILIGIIIILVLFITGIIKLPNNSNINEAFTQISDLTNAYNSQASSKRPVTDLLAKNVMPEEHQCFINFYSLGCRYTGYIGPFFEGEWNPDVAVQSAVNAGCRTFILEIDYLEDCVDNNKYFPQIVVRDSQNKLRINPKTNKPLCNSPQHSNIGDVCEKINYYAFADSCQNKTDPVVIVLYFLRQPPGSYKSKAVLDYFSDVAKALAPFQNKLITNELNGGSFFRQKQESKLLLNKITDYNNKVLIFSNANTIGFREVSYKPMEDLDFLTNLRLHATQTKLGITESGSGEVFGVLSTDDDFMNIPPDRTDITVEDTKYRWTICLSKDPSKPVPKATYDKITSTYGVNCIPAMLFDTKQSEFLFTDKLFKTYSYIPKPEPLRNIKPPIVTPGEANPTMNSNQGKILTSAV